MRCRGEVAFFESLVEVIERLVKRTESVSREPAESPGRNLPKPSHMFREAEELDFLICRQKSTSSTAGLMAVNA
jgi:hypothetical protein